MSEASPILALIDKQELAVQVSFPPRLTRTWSMRIRADGTRELRLPTAFGQAPEPIAQALLDWAMLDRPRLKKNRAAYHKTKRTFEDTARDWLLTNAKSVSTRKTPSKRPDYTTHGCLWDLAEVRDHINRVCFDNSVETLVRWGRPGSRLSFQTTKILADGTAVHVVTIGGVYNHPDVPRFAIESIMHHEMLHIAIPPTTGNGRRIIHGREFRAAEKAFIHHDAWHRWLRHDLPLLMRPASKQKRLFNLPIRLSLFG